MLIDPSTIQQGNTRKATHSGFDSTATLITQAVRQELEPALEKLDRQNAVVFTTHGAWSMHHLATALLQRAGKGCEVWIASYNFTRKAAETFGNLKSLGYIQRLYALLDKRMVSAESKSYGVLLTLCEGLHLMKNHAKIILVFGEKDSYMVIGSANLTQNRRFEAGSIFKNIPAIAAMRNTLRDELERKTT